MDTGEVELLVRDESKHVNAITVDNNINAASNEVREASKPCQYGACSCSLWGCKTVQGRRRWAIIAPISIALLLVIILASSLAVYQRGRGPTTFVASSIASTSR